MSTGRDKQMERQTDGKINRQIDRQEDKLTDDLINRQQERQKTDRKMK